MNCTPRDAPVNLHPFGNPCTALFFQLSAYRCPISWAASFGSKLSALVLSITEVRFSAAFLISASDEVLKSLLSVAVISGYLPSFFVRSSSIIGVISFLIWSYCFSIPPILSRSNPADTPKDGIVPSIVRFPPAERDLREVGSIFPRTFLVLRSCLTPALSPQIGITLSVSPSFTGVAPRFPPTERFPVFHLTASVFHAKLTPTNGSPSIAIPVPRVKESPFKIWFSGTFTPTPRPLTFLSTPGSLILESK